MSENDYVDQYRDLKLFYKEYVGEILMNPFISYAGMKNKYPIQVIDVRHQEGLNSPKRIQHYEEFKTDPDNVNARLIVILVRHRRIEMISTGIKVIEIKVK